jgi:uncharacterized protein
LKAEYARDAAFAVIMAVVAYSQAAAQVPQFAEREVTFRNGAVELSGTLMLPSAQSPSPAVVFLHGSGPHTRAGFRPYAEEFARLGLASIFFDKRGSGESGGSWITASLEDLTGDALAAVAYLKAEKRIDSKRIGFWGVSQAGWVAPAAASQSEDIAFMILISGGGARPLESELFSYQQQFERAGLSPEDAAQAMEVLEAYFEYLATGEGRTQFIARLDSIRQGRLSPLAEQLDRVLPSEANRPNWSWVATYDPAQDIENVRCPVLLLFGERDTDHPTAVAVDRWRNALAKGGNDQLTLIFFPGAGHGIRMGAGHSGAGRAPFADGYAEVQLGWLWRYVVARTQ